MQVYRPVKRSTTATPDAHRPAARLAVGQAGDAHHPAHALDDEVVAGALGVGAVLPEAGDRGVDQPRVGRAKRLRVEAELLEPADLEILDDDVGICGQPANQRRAFRLGEIDRRRLLSAVGAEEIGGDAVLAFAVPRRAPVARVVAAARAARP